MGQLRHRLRNAFERVVFEFTADVIRADDALAFAYDGFTVGEYGGAFAENANSRDLGVRHNNFSFW